MPGPETTELSATFGAELRRLRKAHGLSLRALQHRVNYAYSYLSKVENGTRPPSLALAEACQDTLGGHLVELAYEYARHAQTPTLVVPAELPPIGEFVGRQDDLAALSSAASRITHPGSVRVVTVDGAPGVGKTSLALSWAHTARGDFPDGQLFVNLRGYDHHTLRSVPSHVLEEFLRSLGMPAALIPVGADQRSATLRSLLADRRVLLVLDNAADSQQVLPLLPSGAGNLVVVTSRSRLSGLSVRSQGGRVTVGPLHSPDAHDLLSRVIGTDRVQAEPHAATLTARRCDHLPLALRVAAEHIALHPHHRLSELADELAAERDRLDVLADDAVTMRAVFGWSYHHLTGEQARLFRQLGLHRGPEISVSAAAALHDCTPVVARRRLEQLAEAHLVEEIDRDRYRLHDLLRVYAGERAHTEDDPEDNARAGLRVLEWYLHSSAAANDPLAPQRGLPPLDPPTTGTVADSFNDYDAALAWCDREAVNIVYAVDQARQHGHPVLAWKLAVCNWNYYWLRKRWNLWIGAHQRGLEAAREADDVLGQAWCLHNLGAPHMELRRWEQAQEYLHEAVRLRRQIGDRWGLGWSLFAAGATNMELGRLVRACEQFREAIEVFRGIDFDYGRGAGLGWLGTALRKLHRQDEALQTLHESLATFEAIGSARDGESFTLVRLGATYQEQGEHRTALEYLDRALTLRKASDDQWGQAEVLLSRGHVLASTGHTAAAHDAWTQAAGIFERLRDPRAADARAQLATLEDDEFI